MSLNLTTIVLASGQRYRVVTSWDAFCVRLRSGQVRVYRKMCDRDQPQAVVRVETVLKPERAGVEA
jgi:hypothetical protein